MPFADFVAFSVTCLAARTISVPAIRMGHRAAMFAAWFLAIAGMANGVLHPLLAVAEQRYFPGLVSAPLVGVAAVILWLRLHAATESLR